MKDITIQIHEPFAEFLMASPEEHSFELSLLDAVRFAGHACPSIVGAFMVSRHAVSRLFEDSNICVRGDVQIEMSTGPMDGPSGPISNIFAFVFGAFEKSGFGGLGGKNFVRRNLLRYNVADVPAKAVRFTRLSTRKSIHVFYSSEKAQVIIDSSWPFQKQWRVRIDRISKHPEEVIWCEPCD
jgi:hypothetical protein